MTNQDYWQTIVGDSSPEEFLRTYGTADPDLGLERFLEDRGHLFGVLNQGSWDATFEATEQHHILTARIYLRSYLEDTREEWESALEAKPPKVVRRYKPVYDLPVPEAPSPEPAAPAEEPPAETPEPAGEADGPSGEQTGEAPEPDANPDAGHEHDADTGDASPDQAPDSTAPEADASQAHGPEPEDAESPDTQNSAGAESRDQ